LLPSIFPIFTKNNEICLNNDRNSNKILKKEKTNRISRIYKGKAVSLLEIAQKRAARARNDLAGKVLAVRKLVHDGNNTLSLITVTSRIALDELKTGDPETLKEDLETIVKAGEQLTATLANIRAIFVPSSKTTVFTPPVAPINLDRKTTAVKNVLVVDDDPILRTFLAGVLTKRGLTVTQAGNAEAAIPLLANGRFDLIITDVDMDPAGMNGLELTELITRTYPQSKVFVMSGDCAAERERAARENGAERFFPKPFIISDILKAIL